MNINTFNNTNHLFKIIYFIKVNLKLYCYKNLFKINIK